MPLVLLIWCVLLNILTIILHIALILNVLIPMMSTISVKKLVFNVKHMIMQLIHVLHLSLGILIWILDGQLLTLQIYRTKIVLGNKHKELFLAHQRHHITTLLILSVLHVNQNKHSIMTTINATTASNLMYIILIYVNASWEIQIE